MFVFNKYFKDILKYLKYFIVVQRDDQEMFFSEIFRYYCANTHLWYIEGIWNT